MSPTPKAGGENRVLVRLFVATVVALVAATTVAFNSLPSNALRTSDDGNTSLRLLLPEGWAFFTIDPRKPYPEPYSRSADGTWKKRGVDTTATPAMLFGLNRTDRAQGIEIGLLLEPVKKEWWKDCKGSPMDCLNQATPQSRIHNRAPRPGLCGDIGMVLPDPLPWAWRKTGKQDEMPSQVVRLDVQCS